MQHAIPIVFLFSFSKILLLYYSLNLRHHHQRSSIWTTPSIIFVSNAIVPTNLDSSSAFDICLWIVLIWCVLNWVCLSDFWVRYILVFLLLKEGAVGSDSDLVGGLALHLVVSIGHQGSHFKEWNLTVRRKVSATSSQKAVHKWELHSVTCH